MTYVVGILCKMYEILKFSHKDQVLGRLQSGPIYRSPSETGGFATGGPTGTMEVYISPDGK